MINLQFDFSKFGCNEKAVRELVQEIVRCMNESNLEIIVSCVNALAGIENPAGIKDAIAAMESCFDKLTGEWKTGVDQRRMAERLAAALAALRGEGSAK